MLAHSTSPPAPHACAASTSRSTGGLWRRGGRHLMALADRGAKRAKTGITLAMNGQNMDNAVGHALARPVSSYQHRVGDKFVCPGFVAQNHFIEVPLDYRDPQSSTIQIFVRELYAPSRMDCDQPGLLYLQGGPGFEGPRTTELSGWMKSALATFRLYLMDQRGTGMSSPITPSTLAAISGAAAQAQYLTNFRADNIVADAEVVRRCLSSSSSGIQQRWSIMGQSFGGFCSLTYLSFAPNSLNEVLLTGGIPPGIDLPCGAHLAYSALFRRVIQQNDKYYSRFPGDEVLVRNIVRVLQDHPEGGPLTPGGNRVSVRLFQTLGLNSLGGYGGFERLHYLLERAFDGYTSGKQLSYAFLAGFDVWLPWHTNPLYVLLHESIYCQGAASGWAASTVLQNDFEDYFNAATRTAKGQRVYFTGEMVFPFMFDDVAALRPFKEAAQLLADKEDWGPLYDRKVLQQNKVPVAAASYVEDMYVDWNMAQQTAAQVNGIRQWSTSEFMHSGIRDDGSHIFDRLLSMARGNIPIY